MVKSLTIPPRNDETVLPDKTQPTGDNRFVPADTLIYFAGQLREADRERRAAAKKYEGVRKAFKNTGVTLRVFDLVSDLAEQDDPDAFEKFFDEATHVAQAFAIAPPGTQLSLMDMLNDVEKAKKQGYNRGLQGDNPDTQAYPENTELGQAHLDGWNDGQVVRQREFLNHNERARQEEAAAAEKKAAATKRKEEREAKKAAKEGRSVPTNDDGETVN
mgnify:CR=1 FL=1